MTNSIKNKIWIFVWLLTLGLFTYLLWNRGIPLWQKLLTISLTLFTGILNVLSRINDDYDLEFTNETVYLKKTFSKQKQYSLKNILRWSETHYSLAEIKTQSIIRIDTESGEKIILKKRGAKDYEKVSDYLNDNFSSQYESYD